MYVILRIKEAYIADSYLENLNSDKTILKSALTNCAALTWFNPHVYIDTLILIGKFLLSMKMIYFFVQVQVLPAFCSSFHWDWCRIYRRQWVLKKLGKC